MLYGEIKNQSEGKSVEILFERDNKEMSVGAKRQKLLERATGEYVVFCDDDDRIAKDYVYQILKALESNPDAVGFHIHCSGCDGVTASASNRWDDWAENKGGFDYVRTPYQKTPIKREIALRIGYPDMRFGEDYFYSKRLKESKLIQTEVYIPKVLYYYQFKYEDPTTKYGLNGL
jgi:glycosyltransferase involved in cell wall biosynthesis